MLVVISILMFILLVAIVILLLGCYAILNMIWYGVTPNEEDRKNSREYFKQSLTNKDK